MRALLKMMFFTCLLWAVAGCHDRGRSNQAEQESPLKPIAIFYGDFLNQHQGKPPASEAEFKAFLKETKNADRLKETFKITDIDKLLISPRDNKPYVINFGTMSGNLGPGGLPVVAYEKEGLKGKRFVASALGGVVEVDEAEFRKMIPNPQ
ncbi:MAG: hypothetical protein ACKVP0_27630 [Pirellulaceae bacterium]